MVFDGDRVYGFGRQPALFVWSHVLENHLFCSASQADPEAISRVKQWSDKVGGRNAIFNRRTTRSTPLLSRLAPKLHWSVKNPPLHVRAMVLADQTLFIAGPPDVVDEDEAYEQPGDPAVKNKIEEQDAAYEGERGALLMGVSTIDGKTLFRLDLPALPVWDGMAVADSRLYLTTSDGKLLCFDKQ